MAEQRFDPFSENLIVPSDNSIPAERSLKDEPVAAGLDFLRDESPKQRKKPRKPILLILTVCILLVAIIWLALEAREATRRQEALAKELGNLQESLRLSNNARLEDSERFQSTLATVRAKAQNAEDQTTQLLAISRLTGEWVQEEESAIAADAQAVSRLYFGVEHRGWAMYQPKEGKQLRVEFHWEVVYWSAAQQLRVEFMFPDGKKLSHFEFRDPTTLRFKVWSSETAALTGTFRRQTK